MTPTVFHIIWLLRKRTRATCEVFFLVLTLKSEFWDLSQNSDYSQNSEV